jgi:hypothetical protein
MVMHICNPSIQGARQEDLEFKARLGKTLSPSKERLVSKLLSMNFYNFLDLHVCHLTLIHREYL